MIKLDKWDSQILLLSKDWFNKELDELGKSNLDGLKALWTDRCYVKLEHVYEGILVQHLVELMEKLGILKKREMTEILFNMVKFKPGFNKYGFKRDREITIQEELVNSILCEISTVAVLDKNKEPIIEYHEKYTSFLDVFTRVEDEEISV